MRAMVLREFGPPEVLHYEDVPEPVAGPGEVVIEVHAVSVNRVLDVAVRRGAESNRGVVLPHVLGCDPAGVVTAVGEGVTERRPGDRVAVFQGLGNRRMFGIHCWGGDAQRTKAPAEATRLVPEGVPFADVVVIARHAPVAWNLLVNLAQVAAGDWVLVMGASGNLGSLGIQIAKNLGATVIACAGSDERAEIGLSLGADYAINHARQDLLAEARRLTKGRGIDVVYDNIANPETTPKAIEALRLGGRLVTAGAHGGPVVPVNFFHLYARRATIRASPDSSPDDAIPSFEAAAAGKLRVLIEKVLPLAQAIEAHRMVEFSPATGKIILDPTLG